MFWRLVLAHVLTDFFLQPSLIADDKQSLKSNFFHFLILWASSILLTIDLWSKRLFIGIVLIAVIHGVIDFIKSQFTSLLARKFQNRGCSESEWVLFVLDQLAHILTILIIVSLISIQGCWIYVKLYTQLTSNKVIITISFAIAIISGGSYFTSKICSFFSANINNNGDKTDLQKAGRYIGYFERTLTMLSVALGKYEIIGFLIAAKSIIRHPEAKKGTALTEYFIIGTLASITWATLLAVLYKHLISQ